MGLFFKSSPWIKAGELAKLGAQNRFVHKKREFALFKKDGSVYALDDICSHEYARLSDGELWDEFIYCPKHGSCFNIKTGALRNPPATAPVKAYETKIENGVVYIKI